VLDERNIAKPLDLTGIYRVIVGGESGLRARAMDLDLSREICAASLEHIPCVCGDAETGGCLHVGPASFLKQRGGRTGQRGGDEAALDDRHSLEFPVSAAVLA
jgi:protein gp37